MQADLAHTFTPSRTVLDLTAVELGRLVAGGEVSSEELVRGYLERIRAENPSLSAFVSLREKAALEEARRVRKGSPRSSLDGVPTGLKDLNMLRGSFTRYGSRAFRYLWSPVDDAIAKRMRAAGMIILGKLATSELGVVPVTEPEIHPPTRNPVDRTRSAGGSSGGSGAAVGGGLIPIAHGSDGAGSIRIPAGFCGLVGFKPSRGLVPNPHRGIDADGLISNGPLARTVEDAAAFLDVLTGRRGPGSFAERVHAPIRRKLRVRFSVDNAVSAVEPEIAAAVAGVAKRLEGAGHAVEEARWFAGKISDFLPIWERQAASPPVPSERVLQPVTRWLRARGRRVVHAEVDALAREMRHKIDAWFGAADLWLSPTLPAFPPKIGAFDGLAPEAAFHAMAPYGAFTAIYNLAGFPAISLPVGRAANGLPLSVQIAARAGQDARVLAAAQALFLDTPSGLR